MGSPLLSLPAELLEHILWHLPTRDLYLAQRVCKEWQSLIVGSVALKSALFLLPQEVQRCLRWTYRSYAMIAGEPDEEQPEKRTFRISRATPADQRGAKITHYGGDGRRGRLVESRYHFGRINDIFFDHDPRYDFWHRRVHLSHEPYEELQLNRALRLAVRSPCAGTWRNMHVTQPPCKRVDYTWDFRKASEPPGRRRRVAPHQTEVNKQDKITCEQGIAVGHIVDRIRALEDEVEGEISCSSSRIQVYSFLCLSEHDKAQIRDVDDSSDDGADFVGQELSPDSSPVPSSEDHHTEVEEDQDQEDNPTANLAHELGVHG